MEAKMGTRTGIEWTDSTWSPMRARVKPDAVAIAVEKGYTSLVAIADKMAGRTGQHCEHVSPGCERCYAETNNHRCLPANGTGLPYDRRSRDLVEAFVDENALMQPFHWRPVLQNDGTYLRGSEQARRMAQLPAHRPRRIFVENQSDLFGEWVTDQMLDRVFAVMALCQWHIFQVLTKRPARLQSYCSDDAALGRILRAADGLAKILKGRAVMKAWEVDDGMGGRHLPNVWLGVSVENQAAADERIPLLLRTPAAVRFISAEPLLGPIALPHLVSLACMVTSELPIPPALSVPAGQHIAFSNPHGALAVAAQGGGLLGIKPGEFVDQGTGLDWVICGGESGPGARVMHPAWARSLRDQCVDPGVPFFFKQWGAWRPAKDGRLIVAEDGHIRPKHETLTDKDCRMRREAKKAAGAELDGREWKQFPGGK
jgi:protein gp37